MPTVGTSTMGRRSGRRQGARLGQWARLGRWAGLVALLALIGVTLSIARAQVSTRPLREREFIGGGAWSWFGDPRAVFHAGAHRRSYIGWDAPDGPRAGWTSSP